MKFRTTRWLLVTVLLIALSGATMAAESLLAAKFVAGGWDPAQWTLAKNPTVEHLGKWVQRDEYIENATPDDPAKKTALDQSLTTMIYNTKFGGNWTATGTFQLDGSAPGIVIVQDWAPDAQGRPQYGEFYEAIIWEKGVNLWHHFAGADGKRTYELAAYCQFPLKPDVKYALEVQRKGKRLEMRIDGHIVGLDISTLPPEVFLGVLGCEGVSRVYDFNVTR